MAETFAPGSKLSAVIRAFSRGSHLRFVRCGPKIVAPHEPALALCGTMSQSEFAHSAAWFKSPCSPSRFSSLSISHNLTTGYEGSDFPARIVRCPCGVLAPLTIESVNAQVRKIIKTRGHFPSDDAASKLIWLALRNITADWGTAAQDWKTAMNQFAILYEDRFTRGAHGAA